MKTPNKTQGDRRKSERRHTAERRSEPMRAAIGDRRVMDGRGVAQAMTDALEDILAWERASERMLKVADASTADVSAAASTSH
jgi:hypothetical protein